LKRQLGGFALAGITPNSVDTLVITLHWQVDIAISIDVYFLVIIYFDHEWHQLLFQV
jgi:hypothetical protein